MRIEPARPDLFRLAVHQVTLRPQKTAAQIYEEKRKAQVAENGAKHHARKKAAEFCQILEIINSGTNTCTGIADTLNETKKWVTNRLQPMMAKGIVKKVYLDASTVIYEPLKTAEQVMAEVDADAETGQE